MDQLLLESEKPPSLGDSFPSEAFGYGTSEYWLFLEALAEGLLEYEARNGGATYGVEPLPAA